MNTCKTNDLLKDVKTYASNLPDIELELDTINNKLVDIGITLAKNENKKIFSAYLSDGTNDYLDTIDYTSSPINFSWTNTFDKPVYITRYDFVYRHQSSTEPHSTDSYHCNEEFRTKIGAMNDAGDDYENNYIEYFRNVEYPHTNGLKRNIFSDVAWSWHHRFNEISNDIEIGVSKKFGHYIAGNFTTSEGYAFGPLGIIYGYYYD